MQGVSAENRSHVTPGTYGYSADRTTTEEGFQHGSTRLYQPESPCWAFSLHQCSDPPLAVSEWDLLLKRLGLTDIEALTAVRQGTETSQLITRFVRGQFRQHFVPEDVLLAVKMQWEVARQILELRALSCSTSPNPLS